MKSSRGHLICSSFVNIRSLTKFYSNLNKKICGGDVEKMWGTFHQNSLIACCIFIAEWGGPGIMMKQYLNSVG